MLLVVTKWTSIIFLALLIVTVSCSTDTKIDEQPIDNPIGTFNQNSTFKLVVYNGFLYAGTESGLFRKPVDPNISKWESLGLGDASIRTFIVFSEEELLASAAYQDHQNNTLAKTTDSGKTWIAFQNGFGGERSPTTIPNTMDVNPENSSILFARIAPYANVARSTNKGKSWKSVLLTWENTNLAASFFVKVDQYHPDIIWAGGATAIFQPTLFTSKDGGDHWKGLLVTKNVEANIYDLIISPKNANEVLAGLGGNVPASNIIRKSSDGGETWTTVLQGISTRTLTHSVRDPQRIYASGINQDSTLFFATSTNFGDTWQTIEVQNSPTGIRVNDMVSVIVAGKEVLYFATNKGVYSYTFAE